MNSSNQSGHNNHILQSPGADKLAEQLTQRFLAAAKELERFRKEQEPLAASDAEITFYKTNPDGSVVTMDAEGRTTALADRGGKQVYQFVYKDRQSKEPDSIKLSDGTTLVRRIEVKELGQSCTVWSMNPNDQTKDFTDFPNSTLTINKDGSFKIRYRCMLASAIKREEVVREMSFTVRGKKVAEYEKVAFARVGPKNALTVKEGLVKRVSSS